MIMKENPYNIEEFLDILEEIDYLLAYLYDKLRLVPKPMIDIQTKVITFRSVVDELKVAFEIEEDELYG